MFGPLPWRVIAVDEDLLLGRPPGCPTAVNPEVPLSNWIFLPRRKRYAPQGSIPGLGVIVREPRVTPCRPTPPTIVGADNLMANLDKVWVAAHDKAERSH
jgi:hypothetical protein